MRDLNSSYTLCLKCLSVLENSPELSRCPNCLSVVLKRKKNSIQNTKVYLITAFILYIPANLFPIMTVKSFGSEIPSTIIGGVIDLFRAKMYFVSAVVFTASVLIPLLKMLVLFYLLTPIKHGTIEEKRVKTKLYYFIEQIGKWSMLDIFVIAILISVVKLNYVAEISVNTGAVFFAIVVLLTIFATKSFDVRLIWDK